MVTAGPFRLMPVNSPPVLRMPGSWLTTGIDGSAALSISRRPMSGTEHHLAAAGADVAVDRARAGGGVPGDGLGDGEGRPALGHRVEPLPVLRGREGRRR